MRSAMNEPPDEGGTPGKVCLPNYESQRRSSTLLGGKASHAATVPVNCRSARAALSSDELAEWVRSRRGQASRKTLTLCPEFVCYEEPDGSRTVESTPELERAMDIARFGISAAKGVDMRLAQARALLELSEFTAGHEKDTDALLSLLAEAFGQPALAVLNTPPAAASIPPLRGEAQGAGTQPVAVKQREKAECAADSLTAAVKSALRSLVNWKFPLPDKRSTQPDGIDLVWIMHLTAKDIFRKTLERPTQQLIRETMEDDGYGFHGHDAEQRWADLFAAAGLDRLPRN